jgi:hypothetical protein
LARWAGVGVFVLAATTLNCDGPTEPEYEGVWEVVPTPACAAAVKDIFFVSPNNGWAVAYNQIWHYDGRAWTLRKKFLHENPNYEYGVHSLWFNGADDGWVSGAEIKGPYEFVTKMWHYNGTYFEEVPVPNVGSAVELFFIASDDAWGIGGDKALRYDGKKWYQSEFNTWGWTDSFFFDSSDGWAVSLHSIFKWDGKAWNRVKTVDNWFECIGFAGPENGWAMGWREEYSGEPPVYRYDGSTWANHGGFNAAVFFNDVEFLGADYGWAIGYHTFFWDGEKWTRYDIPRTEGSGYDYPLSIECVSEAEVWVGTNDGRILRFRGF